VVSVSSRCIATGGLADLFDEHTRVFDAIEPHLTIQGVSLLYAMATETKR
jgi:type III pantothenate kinase